MDLFEDQENVVSTFWGNKDTGILFFPFLITGH